jgi:hypothetical protein
MFQQTGQDLEPDPDAELSEKSIRIWKKILPDSQHRWRTGVIDASLRLPTRSTVSLYALKLVTFSEDDILLPLSK